MFRSIIKSPVAFAAGDFFDPAGTRPPAGSSQEGKSGG